MWTRLGPFCMLMSPTVSMHFVCGCKQIITLCVIRITPLKAHTTLCHLVPQIYSMWVSLLHVVLRNRGAEDCNWHWLQQSQVNLGCTFCISAPWWKHGVVQLSAQHVVLQGSQAAVIGQNFISLCILTFGDISLHSWIRPVFGSELVYWRWVG